MARCEIQWMDAQGDLTPDNNTAIGRVQCAPRCEIFSDTMVRFGRSRWFYICHDHAQRLNGPGMQDWSFQPLEILN